MPSVRDQASSPGASVSAELGCTFATVAGAVGSVEPGLLGFKGLADVRVFAVLDELPGSVWFAGVASGFDSVVGGTVAEGPGIVGLFGANGSVGRGPDGFVKLGGGFGVVGADGPVFDELVGTDEIVGRDSGGFARFCGGFEGAGADGHPVVIVFEELAETCGPGLVFSGLAGAMR